MLTYKVAKKYSKGPEQLIAKFDSVEDAKDYITNKLQQDATMRVNAAYLLYDTGELMQTFDQSTAAGDTTAAGGSSSAGGKGSSQGFRPNPMQTTLRPSGMPPSSSTNEDDKKK